MTNKMTAYWIRVDSKSNESVLIRDREEHKETQRRCCEDRGRDWSDVSISQGVPRIVVTHEKVGERHRAVFPLERPEGTGPDNSPVLYFWHPEL